MKLRDLLLLGALLISQTLAAQVTQTFCITGDSDGKGWTWTLVGNGLPSLQVTATGTRGGALELANAWVNSINLAQGNPPGYVAEVTGLDDRGRACFTITADRRFLLGVDGCTVTGNPKGCTFNPHVVEVSTADS